MKIFLCVHFILLMTFSGSIAAPLPKHWHETKGFGTDIKAGLYGEIYKVTNLKSSGAGSLKDAVSKSNRLIVFEVGGVITGGFSIANNVTVAGQTAPYPGITIIKGGITVNGSNIVLSHITTCLGSAVGGHPDAGNIGGKNIVYDHVAVYWGKDETLSLQSTSDVTLYKCIIGEGLQFTGHEDGEHSKGLHIQIKNVRLSVIGNLCAHNAIRNPRIDICTVFLANHVVYNWGPAWDHTGPKLKSEDQIASCAHCFNKVISGYKGSSTLVENIALQGPESKAEFFYDGHDVTTSGYLKGNIIKDRQGNDLKQANTEGVFTGGGKSTVTLLDKPPIWPEGMEPLPAHEALYEVLRTVGPHPGRRNAQNARIVKDVADGTGKIINSQNEVGGYPNYTPTTRKLDNIPSGAEARQAWLDSQEDEIAVDRKIDLSRLYSMVGSRASDKLFDGTSVNHKVNHQPDGFGIKLSQRNVRNKQLYASFNLSKSTSVSVKLFDLAGNMVAHQQKHCNTGQNEIVTDVERLPVGLYICRFNIGNKVVNHKFYCY